MELLNSAQEEALGIETESVAFQKLLIFKTGRESAEGLFPHFQNSYFPLINIDHIYYYNLPQSHFIANIYAVFFGLVNDECLGMLPLTEEAVS